MADSYQQLLDKLVDVPDPPLPTRTSPLTDMSSGQALKATIILLIVAVVAGVGATALFKSGHWVWGSVVGLFAALFAVGAFSKKARVAACPFCSTDITVTFEESRDPLQCETCWDYSMYDGSVLRPLDPATTAPTPTFDAPLFEDARWPKACVACGAPPTRLDDASGRTMNAAMLVVGRVSVSSAQAAGIPYCADHKDAVHVKVQQDRRVRVLWSSLRMMRRYLSANRRQQPRKTGLL
jgi:hypothetical protein